MLFTQKESAIMSASLGVEEAKKATCCSLTPRTKNKLEMSVLLASIILVLGMFSLPIIFYFSLAQTVPPPTTNNSISVSCEQLSWNERPVSEEEACNGAMPYTGQLCQQVLLSWQECVGSVSNELMVGSKELIDEGTIELISGLLNSQSKECKMAGMEFLCQISYPLHDCSRKLVYSATKESCLTVSMKLCVSLWNMYPLPDCNSLILSVGSDESTSSGSTRLPDTSDQSPLPSDTNISCSDGFFENNSVCLPSCEHWSANSRSAVSALFVIRIVACFVAIFGGVSVVVGSIIRYKSMMTYPSIFLVYMTLSYCIFAFMVLIGTLDTKLLCSSRNLVESLETSTDFCIVIGVTQQYTLFLSSLWWLFHVAAIFHKIMFPLHAMRIKDKTKYILFIFTIIGLLIPTAGVIPPLVDEDFEYTISTFPPFLCVPREGITHFNYFSGPFIINIVLAIGVAMLIPLFWTVHKHSVTIPGEKGILFTNISISTAERKILFVLLYYVIFGIITLVYFGIIISETDMFVAAVKDNILCEFGGTDRECNHSILEQYAHPELSGVTYLLMGFIPAVNLTFVIQWTKARTVLSKWLKVRGKRDRSQTSVKSTEATSSM